MPQALRFHNLVCGLPRHLSGQAQSHLQSFHQSAPFPVPAPISPWRSGSCTMKGKSCSSLQKEGKESWELVWISLQKQRIQTSRLSLAMYRCYDSYDYNERSTVGAFRLAYKPWKSALRTTNQQASGRQNAKHGTRSRILFQSVWATSAMGTQKVESVAEEQ